MLNHLDHILNPMAKRNPFSEIGSEWTVYFLWSSCPSNQRPPRSNSEGTPLHKGRTSKLSLRRHVQMRCRMFTSWCKSKPANCLESFHPCQSAGLCILPKRGMWSLWTLQDEHFLANEFTNWHHGLKGGQRLVICWYPNHMYKAIPHPTTSYAEIRAHNLLPIFKSHQRINSWIWSRLDCKRQAMCQKSMSTTAKSHGSHSCLCQPCSKPSLIGRTSPGTLWLCTVPPGPWTTILRYTRPQAKETCPVPLRALPLYLGFIHFTHRVLRLSNLLRCWIQKFKQNHQRGLSACKKHSALSQKLSWKTRRALTSFICTILVMKIVFGKYLDRVAHYLHTPRFI